MTENRHPLVSDYLARLRTEAIRLDAHDASELLADIEAGRVDVIVVYKIDRLSRSLMDFARLVEVFDCLASAPMRQNWRIEEGRISGSS